jgi:hypothetical protein
LLAGLSWVVQLVVYPSFRVVGRTSEWQRFHAQHSRRITWVVGPPWLLQAVTLSVLLLRFDHPVLLAAASVLALATVALTVLGAVPLHQRLSDYDDDLVRRLLVVSAWRTAAWTGGAVVSLLLV